MKYKLIERANPRDRSLPNKWYASPVNSGKVTEKSIAKEIASRSSLTAGDVMNVLQNFLDLLPNHLIDGKSVKLGDFGSFRISFSSTGVETKEDFTTDKIKGRKVIFTPSSDFKNGLNRISFEKQ
ncbi:HU-HIG domain-containing protein [Tenacibaculum sp. 190524A02b]|uniref:Viral histone-like protein n=1 Tax=Tenacibaculum vairaonense TaxID=3137860 RepID=A0ABM9PN96_9FLAO